MFIFTIKHHFLYSHLKQQAGGHAHSQAGTSGNHPTVNPSTRPLPTPDLKGQPPPPPPSGPHPPTVPQGHIVASGSRQAVSSGGQRPATTQQQQQPQQQQLGKQPTGSTSSVSVSIFNFKVNTF